MRPSYACLVGCLVAGCETGTDVSFETCVLDVTLAQEAAAPGDEVTAFGGPFVRDDTIAGDPTRDILVAVDGVAAIVTDVASIDAEGTDVTEDCNTCFACRAEAQCAPCGLCDGRELAGERRRECFGSNPTLEEYVPGACDRCEQQVSFVVPDVTAGAHPVSVVNRFGTSAPTDLDVTTSAP